MDGTFSRWLIAKMREKDWSQSELARVAGLSRQAISYYLSEKSKQPDEFALQALARAFKVPVQVVYRAARILPPDPDADPLTEEGTYILEQLEGENKEDAVRYLQLRLRVQEERGKYSVRGKKRAATPG